VVERFAHLSLHKASLEPLTGEKMAFIIRKRRTVIKLTRRKQVKVPSTPATFMCEERTVGQLPLMATELPLGFESQSEPLSDYEIQRLEAEVFAPNRAFIAEQHRLARERLMDPMLPLQAAASQLEEVILRSQGRPVAATDIAALSALLRSVVSAEPQDPLAEAREALERASAFVSKGGYERESAPDGHADVGALWKGINECHASLRGALQKFGWVTVKQRR
jgi:hypothetical protein